MGFRAHENVLIVPSKLGTAFVPVSVQDEIKKSVDEANPREAAFMVAVKLRQVLR